MKFNVKKKFFLPLFVIGLFLLATVIKAQTSCDSTCDPSDSGCLTNLQNLCQVKVTELHNQANTLSNQIAQFNAQIKLTTLKISQTQAQIALLGGRIDQLGDSLTSLTAAFSSRAVETYKLSRFENNFIFILAASDITDAASRLHYLQKIQEEDRSLLEKLQTAQTTYQGQKADQETLQKQLQTQQANLNSQKAAKNSLLIATKNDESKYQQLLSQAKAQLAAFQSFVTRQGGASILSGQTKCNDWGCYYNQRDSEWGNIGLGGSVYTMANYGCLVSSVSMVASHYGKNIKPNDIAVSNDAFVPGTGYLYHSFTANGISVTVSSSSKSIIDSELSAGRPVIAGLYSGPDHFIVITRKDGDNYIMRDPFLENGAGSDGSGRPLTDKYSFSDITSLRLVSFN
jgi:peptidoglycan hydrolase CwlO-like protein